MIRPLRTPAQPPLLDFVDVLNLLGRELPHDNHAERAILTRCLRDPGAFAYLQEAQCGADLYRETHRIAYSLLVALTLQKLPLTLDTLHEQSYAMHVGEQQLGGRAGLVLIFEEDAYADDDLPQLVWRVQQLAAQRRLIECGFSLMRTGFQGDFDLGQAFTRLAKLGSRSNAAMIHYNRHVFAYPQGSAT